MRYLTFSLPTDATPRLGLLHEKRVIEVTTLATRKLTAPPPESLLELIQSGPDTWRQLVEIANDSLPSSVSSYDTEEVRWHAPIPRPTKNVFCLGVNYISHMQESARARGREAKIPEAPVFFTKAPTTVNGPYDVITFDPTISEQIDWEVELAVIVGARGKNISRDAARTHVFGYTILNDVTARDIQMKHLQFFKGKSLDGFCPMGPVVVTADEFGDPQNKRISLRVDGVTKQDGHTGDMIFPIDATIEWLSRGLTLEPGDIIATGTPEGVGFSRTPPEFLEDGSVLETEIQDIGVMRNLVRRI